jgi:hypothetical protein
VTATMTTPSPDTTPRRRRAVTAAVAAGAVVIVAAAVLYAVTRQPDTASPVPVTPTPSMATSAAPTSPTGTATAPAAVLADGCLGGPDPFAAILPAQNAATSDTTGAAAFARTFGRWSITYPIDPAAPQVLETITRPGDPFQSSALDGMNQLARNLQAQGYTESRVVADQGSYRIQPGSTDSSVVLDLILYRQLTRSDGRVEEMKMAITLFLDRDETGPWYMTGSLPPTAADPFAPSPVAPWLPFDGAC